MKRKSAQRVPFKVFGLQRTGTNLMTALLTRNFRARSIERWTDWKHGRIEKLVVRWSDQTVRHVICVRNPYSWLLACYRYFQRAIGRDPTLPPQIQQDPQMSLERFIRTSCYEFASPIDRWNRLHRHWLDVLPRKSTVVVKQEDQLGDQMVVLGRLEKHLKLPRRNQRLRGIARRVDIIPNNADLLKAEYYADGEYMAEYSPSLLEHINRELDPELMKQLGYSVESGTLAEQKVDGITLTIRPGTSDEAAATAAIGDVHDFVQINRWSSRIDKIVEISAGIGITALLAKRHWPDCEVLAYEARPQELRLLRINARRAPGVTPVDSVPDDARIDHALKHFAGEIDVLRLNDLQTILPIVASAYSRNTLERIRWICGRLCTAGSERQRLIDYLTAMHSLEIRPTTDGEFFLARRLHTPRVRAESAATPNRKDKLTERTAFAAAKRFMRTMSNYPAARFRGKGVVICAGGRRYFPCAWVCINMLRHVGVTLPIEMWALNAGELDPQMRALVRPLGVRCVDASRVRRRHPARILDGWELKPYSIIHSRFKEVLFLDADNVAIADPTVLFQSPQYQQRGAVFWPAYRPFEADDPIWKVCHLPYRNEPDFESGQMLIDKSRCWKPLQLTMHLNENSDFYYEYTQGDKETFHMAWRMLGQEYSMVSTPVERIESTACQHDFQGRRMFQHRYQAKWKLEEANPVIPGFLFENLCFRCLDELRQKWG